MLMSKYVDIMADNYMFDDICQDMHYNDNYSCCSLKDYIINRAVSDNMQLIDDMSDNDIYDVYITYRQY